MNIFNLENKPSYDQLISQIEELEAQVSESHDIIDAIRKGEVDAFVVKSDDTHELYTLKSADKSYRVFIEQMSEGALTLNDRNIILYANPRFAELMQTGLEKVIGFDFENFIPAFYKENVTALLKRAWQDGEAKTEISIGLIDGKILPLLLSVNKLMIEEGNALSIIVTDLSLQKESIYQKKALEKKDEFISIASHELKTPVTSIKGYVQLLRHDFDKNGNTAAANMLGKVDAQINKLTSLIGDLLDVKKMENGQLQYHEDKFDFNELVKEVIEETERIIPDNPIKLSLSEPKQVSGDRNKIGQVITNFIDNAAKYSRAGSEIIISSLVKGSSVLLSVKDFGIGIPVDQQSKVFDRFFRVNGEKENTYAGLGLGLYISAEIIKRHNGNLYLKSEPGRGSEFYFEIPFIH